MAAVPQMPTKTTEWEESNLNIDTLVLYRPHPYIDFQV
jgi:hypothetical protein